MRSAFAERKPWATVVISLFLGPTIGMLYLGQGRKGLAYLLLEITAFFLPYYAAHLELLELPMAEILAFLAIRLVAIPHCYLVSKRLQGRSPTAWFARCYNLVGVFVVAPIFVALMARSLYMEPFNIPSGAMLPTLRVGDHLFVSKYAYGYTRYSLPFSPPLFEGRIFGTLPERGDVAVFRKPTDDRIDYIKRIVGLPGDRIQVIGGVLHINDEPVEREKLPGRDTDGPFTDYIETLPNGRRHLIREHGDSELADNTSAYLVPEGHVFAMGDNRDNTLDSRFLNKVGYVPIENLIGRLELVIWNSQDRKIVFLNRR